MIKTRRRSRLPKTIQPELLKCFCAGISAHTAAELTGVNRKTAIIFCLKLREVIFEELAAFEPDFIGGEIEVDESYFSRRQKDKVRPDSIACTDDFGVYDVLESGPTPFAAL